MTRVYLNELSLARAFSCIDEFRQGFGDLLFSKHNGKQLAGVLFCVRGLQDVTVFGDVNLMRAANQTDKDFRRLLLGWLCKRGPFIDEDKLTVDSDLFFFEDNDVTDGGLGEAARRLGNNSPAIVFSFASEQSPRFRVTPLEVIQGFPDEPLAKININNYWIATQALIAAEVEKEVGDWKSAHELWRSRFSKLVIGPSTTEAILKMPFSSGLADRIQERLEVLENVVNEMDNQGKLSQKGEHLIQTYFIGENAHFTDESKSNKAKFKSEMTFPDPSDKTKTITCFWHGKIKTPQTRIHFEWPLPGPFDRMKIAYIGPKISKR